MGNNIINLNTELAIDKMAEITGNPRSYYESFFETLSERVRVEGLKDFRHIWISYNELDNNNRQDLAKKLAGLFHMKNFMLLMSILNGELLQDQKDIQILLDN